MNPLIIAILIFVFLIIFFILPEKKPTNKQKKKSLTYDKNLELKTYDNTPTLKSFANNFASHRPVCPYGFNADTNNAKLYTSDGGTSPRLSYSFKTGSPELLNHVNQRKSVGLATTCIEHIADGVSFTICHNTVDTSNYNIAVAPNNMSGGVMQYRIDLVKKIDKECELNEILTKLS